MFLSKQYYYAKALSNHFHYEQKDRAGVCYTEHLNTVRKYAAELVRHKGVDFTLKVEIAALLHDLLEDTPCSIELMKNPNIFSSSTGINLNLSLSEGISDDIIDAVKLLTKDRKNYNRQAYFSAIRENPIALPVKIADLLHNSELSRLIGNISLDDIERTQLYLDELSFLMGGENEL